MALERLQKIIAAAGIASRRKAEELIQQGLVSVNGKTVTELGSKADPETDSIRVNDKLLKGAERHEYVVLNKPRGYVTTVSDPEGRPTVMELVKSRARLYPIGRLDFNSEGLLLLTNDGAMAHKLMKAASHIPKTYLVKVAGQPREEELRRLRAGVSIAEERNPARRVRTAPAQIRIVKEAENPWLEVTLHEGRNRQIRKMFEEIGHHVEKIRRVRYGPLELDLPPGDSRLLSGKEVAQLQRATEPQTYQRFGTRDTESRDDEKRRRVPSQLKPRRDGDQRSREKRDWKKKISDHKKQGFGVPSRRTIEQREQRVSQSRDQHSTKQRSSAHLSRAQNDNVPSADYQGRRQRRSESRPARADRDLRSKRFGDRSPQSGRSEKRNQRRNRAPNRFRET